MTARMMTRPWPRRSRVRVVLHSDVIAVVVACTFALGIGSLVLRGPTFVDQVSITNPSEYHISVQVSGGDDDGWMSVATARRRSTTTIADVIDQGEVWVFRFRAQGREGGELRIMRRDLAEAGWVVTIPDAVVQQLRDLEAPPPP